MRSGIRCSPRHERSVSGTPEYKPRSVSGGVTSISRSSSFDGSSSTMMAMFRSSLRNLRGIDRSASATSFSNAARSMGDSFQRPAHGFPFRARRLAFGLRRLAIAGTRDHQAEILALVANDTLVAQRLRAADTPSVEDQRVGGSRPPFGRHGVAQLLLDHDRVVGLGDADAVGDA